MLSRIIEKGRRYDWILIAAIFLLTTISLAAIYSVDLSRGQESQFFSKQVIALGIGSALFFVASSIHKTRFETSARFFYIVGILLLIAVLFFGQTIRGTTGWFRFGPFSFQPSEFAKLGLILLLGWWIQKQGRQFRKWDFIGSSMVATGIYVGLIMLQPDLGSALVLLSIWASLLLICGIPKRYIFSFFGIGLVVSLCAWFFLFQDYQKDRITSFLHPEKDPLGSGYNVTQSIIAIGSGQWFGRGLGFGSQSQLHFLPEAQTDFIIAVIGEELGFVGMSAILVLYGIVFWRLIRLATYTRDDFSAYTILGVGILFFVQVVINIGGATGMLPVTGVTLPFLSYGGSSVMINFLLLGIVMSIAKEAHKTKQLVAGNAMEVIYSP